MNTVDTFATNFSTYASVQRLYFFAWTDLPPIIMCNGETLCSHKCSNEVSKLSAR